MIALAEEHVAAADARQADELLAADPLVASTPEEIRTQATELLAELERDIDQQLATVSADSLEAASSGDPAQDFHDLINLDSTFAAIARTFEHTSDPISALGYLLARGSATNRRC